MPARKYYERNREKCKLDSTRRARLKLTGWTDQEYKTALIKQGYRCAICGRHAGTLNKALCADHCHKTGKKRGLLCSNCNVALGRFDDNPSIMRSAISYLCNFFKSDIL